MDISTTGPRPGQGISALPAIAEAAQTGPQGHAAPVEDRAIRVQHMAAHDAAQDLRHAAPQVLQLQSAESLARLTLAQTEPARLAVAQPEGRAAREGLQMRAQRAYSETSGIEAEARALLDRVVLLPEKGDLSLEASQLPPYGPPPFGPAPPDQTSAAPNPQVNSGLEQTPADTPNT